MRRQPRPSNDSLDPGESCLEKARRFVRRGEDRKALIAFEEACCFFARDAKVWALYAAHCRRLGKYADAERGFRQALFLRERERDEARARVIRGLLETLSAEAA